MKTIVRFAYVMFGVLATLSACKRDRDERDSSKTTSPSTSSSAVEDPEPASFNRFRVEGAENNTVFDASAILSPQKNGKSQLELTVPADYRQLNGVAYIAVLFLPPGFPWKPGKYEISPDHARRTDALGAALLVQRAAFEPFAHSPRGELTLATAGEKLVGYFNFEVSNTDAAGVLPKKTKVVGQFEMKAQR